MSNVTNPLTFLNFVAGRVGAENLVGAKALSFGGAGASLALILLIAQIGVGKPDVVWSLGFAAAALPLWLAVALSYDAWLSLGLDAFDFFSRMWLPRTQLITIVVALVFLFVSIWFLLHSLVPLAAMVFVITSVIGIVMILFALIGAVLRIQHHMNAQAK